MQVQFMIKLYYQIQMQLMTLFHFQVINWKVKDQLNIGESLLTCKIIIQGSISQIKLVQLY